MKKLGINIPDYGLGRYEKYKKDLQEKHKKSNQNFPKPDRFYTPEPDKREENKRRLKLEMDILLEKNFIVPRSID